MSRLNEIKERAAAATAGPWNRSGDYLYAGAILLDNLEDQRFIIESREDVPWLVKVVEEFADFLTYLANDLDNAARQGAKTDEPEGERFIVLSDTLAKDLSAKMREVVSGLDK